MLAITQRNLKLYFRNRASVLFSLMSALIVLGLYLVFLKNGMQKNWSHLPDAIQLLDPWLIAGMMSVTATTASLNAIEQLVRDRQGHQLQDFLVTPTKSAWIQLGYFLSAVLIAVIMQLAVLLVAAGYFSFADQIQIRLSILPALIAIIFLNGLCATALNLVIISFVKKVTTLSIIGSIVGTASGFLAGIYIPIGTLPAFSQNLIKLYPGAYSASLFRRILMQPQIVVSFRHVKEGQLALFKKMLGIGYQWESMTTFTQEFIVLAAVTIIALVLVLAENRWANSRQA